MRNKWKKVLAAACTASMLMTMPGFSVLADAMQEEEYFITDAEIPEESESFVNAADEDVAYSIDEIIEGDTVIQVTAEEFVGESEIQVGDGVIAAFDEDTGAVEFYSDGGELWSNWVDKIGIMRNRITSIKVKSGTVYLPADSSGYNEDWDYQVFGGLVNLKELDLSGFDTSNVTNMSDMFSSCKSLKNLDLSGFDTSDVTNMKGMFSKCRSLKSLDLSRFDTSNVTDMYAMFNECINLSNLDLCKLCTSNVTNMSYMFLDCDGLINLDLSGFDTSNVTDMSYMFYSCDNLTKLDLSRFNTSNVTDMYGMFAGCSGLTNLDLSGFDTFNVTNMGHMFSYCSGLTNLDMSGFNTSNVANMEYMFNNCSSLTNLDMSGFNTSNVANMDCMFWGCSGLTNLDLSSFDTSRVTNMSAMFANCSSLTNLNLSGFDTSNLENYLNDFLISSCDSLSVLNTPKKNSFIIDLPITMYDESGNEYTSLPVLSKSITLTKDKPDPAIHNILDCTVNLETQSYMYDGKEKKPTVTVNYRTATLLQGTDYSLTYSNNTNAGIATVKVEGIGNYQGEQTITFAIDKADPKLTFASSSVNKTTLDAAFTNKLTKTTDGTVIFKSSNTKVATVNSISGLVTIKGAGTATITATASEGKNYKAGSKVYSLTVKVPVTTPTLKPTVSGFSDVQDPNHAYYKAIYWAADAGITKGYSDGTFGIDRSCTRGEMMMFLWRYAGKPAPKTVSKSPFKDVPKTHTFYTAILWGSQKGITKGYSDGTFGINRNISRGECMMFLWRLKGKPAPKAVAKAPFPDVPKSHVFYNAVLWGYQKKITTGFTSGKLKGKFGVNENCSRGQIVTFLYRAK